MQKSEALSKEEEQHVQLRDAGKNNIVKELKSLGISVEGNWESYKMIKR